MKRIISLILLIFLILLLGMGAFADDPPAKTPILEGSIEPIGNQTYTGSDITPAITVKAGGTTLTPGTDYTCSYSNNVNPGTASVTVTGIGAYEGTVSASFKITRPISAATVDPIPNQIHTGSDIQPEPVVKIGGASLTKGTDYTCTYMNCKDVGTATCTITGTGFYTDSQAVNYNIISETMDISKATVTFPASIIYSGTALQPVPDEVKIDSSVLVFGTDYQILFYSDNVNAGTGTAVLQGIGIYAGTKTANFTIAPKDLSGATISTIADEIFTGAEIKPTPTVTLDSKTLTAGTDYSLSYANNIKANVDSGDPKPTVTVTGQGNYTGTKAANFKITQRSIEECTIDSVPDQTYTGTDIRPALTIKLNSYTLTEGTDYTLTYNNNINAGTATIVITPGSNFYKSRTENFTIKRKQIELPVASDFLYDGKLKVTIPEGTGYTRIEGCEATAVGTYTAKVQPTENYEWTSGTQEVATQIWKIVQPYTITFNGNGGSTPSPRTTDIFGQISQMPADPVYVGHTFLGWYTAPNGGTRIDGTTVFTANTTVYAHWQTDTTNYNVSISKYSGSNLGRAYYRTSPYSSWIELSGNAAQTITMTNGSTVYFRMVPYSGYYSHPLVYRLNSGGYYSVTPYNYEFAVTVTENLQVRLNFSSAVPTGDTGIVQYLIAALASAGTGTGILVGYRRRHRK